MLIFKAPVEKEKGSQAPKVPKCLSVCFCILYTQEQLYSGHKITFKKKKKGSVKFQHSAFLLVAYCGSQRGIDITSKNLRVTIKLLFFHIGIIVNLYLVLSLEILHTWAGLSDHLEKN